MDGVIQDLAITLPRVIGIESSSPQGDRTPRIALQFFPKRASQRRSHRGSVTKARALSISDIFCRRDIDARPLPADRRF
ncbi:putative feruloyl esterase B-2 [Fusarium oxysporum f. sp. albedinis]|nr:putative feruloyl esterase B-2 [Fusarium oxysporum f. sp. albedinis]